MDLISTTSAGWRATYFPAGGAEAIADASPLAHPLHTEVIPSVQAFRYEVPFWSGGLKTNFLAHYVGDFSLEEDAPVTLYLQTSSAAAIEIDGDTVLDIVCETVGGELKTCPVTGAPVCFCNAESGAVSGTIERTATVPLAAGQHRIEVRYLEYTNGRFDTLALDWAVGDSGRLPMLLNGGAGNAAMAGPGLAEAARDLEGDGEWSAVMSWPIIAIHAILTPDGKILTYGTDTLGNQGAGLVYDLWDPTTGAHQTLTKATATDIFCSASVLVPETDEILIVGGDARPLGQPNLGVSDVNTFDYRTQQIVFSPDGPMRHPRWYPTAVTLADGNVVVFGGKGGEDRGGDGFSGQGIAVPELYQPGVGWRELTGAQSDLFSEDWWYPRAWLLSTGEIMTFGGQQRAADSTPDGIWLVDPAGNGSIEKIGDFPTALEFWYSTPAIMYAPDRFLILDDSFSGGLWKLDMTSGSPVVTQVGSLGARRLWSDMTVLADGTVMINGGSRFHNSLSGVSFDVAIWDPRTNGITTGASEATPRLYHSTSILLEDGRVLSVGGGAPGPLVNTNAEIYSPGYLFDADGSLATRPVITDAPELVAPRGTFDIQLDDAADITRLTFVKNGSVTHSLNMESRAIDLAFTRSGNTLTVDPPDNSNILTPGYWMLFAWNSAGTPSVAASIKVDIGGGDGEEIVYADFSGATALALNGAAAIAGDRLRLTAATSNQAGSAFHDQALAIAGDSSFQTEFGFQITGDTNGGDGFTFVLQNAPAGSGALGGIGGDQGLRPTVTNSLAIGFDTYKNWYDAAGDNRLTVLADGDVRNALVEQQVSGVDFDSGAVLRAWIHYDGTTNRLEMFVATSATKPATPALSTTVDLAALVGGQAYAGFTAGTGRAANRHEILDWRLRLE
mgnify:CR=1 FL=1